MARLFRRTGRIILYPARASYHAIAFNGKLWNTLFWEAWYPIPLDKKLIWIAFVGQTIAILTIVELLLFKK